MLRWVGSIGIGPVPRDVEDIMASEFEQRIYGEVRDHLVVGELQLDEAEKQAYGRKAAQLSAAVATAEFTAAIAKLAWLASPGPVTVTTARDAGGTVDTPAEQLRRAEEAAER